MTTRPPRKPKAVTEAESNATIPSRPVIQHTKLLRAELQVKLNNANGALAVADTALTTAAGERDAAIELASKRFDAIREELDAERTDILGSIKGIEAALAATEAKSNVEPIRQPVEVAA